jgi:uncharacterized membrane protein YbhN (UPF0104 family)
MVTTSIDDRDARVTGRRLLRRIAPYVATVAIFVALSRKVPFWTLVDVLRQADYRSFLVLMAANTLFYFVWDTLLLSLVMRWFHRPVSFRELLPARAASYVAAVFNTHLARGTLAFYLTRRTDSRFLHLGSTVIFLVATEFTHLVSWAMLGVIVSNGKAPMHLLLIAPAVAAAWLVFLLYAKLGLTPAVLRGKQPPQWSLLRTFQIAPFRRYVQVILMRVPMFFVSLVIHYFAARSFGIFIPFAALLTFLPVIFMAGALPVTVAHLGTTQAAWILFFGAYAPAPRLLAFSLAAHLSFMVMRACFSLIFGVPALKVLFNDPSVHAPTGRGTRQPTDWALH